VNHRLFAATNRPVSEIGLGCWQLGADWGDVKADDATAILHAAADAGVTFLDTADVYGAGRSETFIGEFLKTRPESFFAATKLGRTGDLFPDKYTRAGVRAATEASLRRLQIERLDLTQLHCVPPAILHAGEIFEWLRELQLEGKIAHFGASVESMDEAHVCLAQDGLASLQIIFNLFRQKPIDALFATAAAKNVALIVRLPLASGLLSGKMTKATTFPADDHRNYNRDGAAFNVGETFAGLPFEKGVELADALKAFVSPELTMADFAQRWILDHPAVTTVITGASRPEQATRNARVSDLPPLSLELHARLRDFYATEVAAHIRGPY
jgi:aryl-alcohol dehydrogenase-like predicted oxidoreductase